MNEQQRLFNLAECSCRKPKFQGPVTNMSPDLTELDAHEQPSDEMRAEWKRFSRQDPRSFLTDDRVDDPRAPPDLAGFRSAGTLTQSQLAASFTHLDPELASQAESDAPILYHPLLPGEFQTLVPFPPV